MGDSTRYLRVLQRVLNELLDVTQHIVNASQVSICHLSWAYIQQAVMLSQLTYK